VNYLALPFIRPAHVRSTFNPSPLPSYLSTTLIESDFSPFPQGFFSSLLRPVENTAKTPASGYGEGLERLDLSIFWAA
jgi:hypothetical protein